MADDAALVTKLRRVIAEDPRTAVLLLEILGPPPGLASPAVESKSDRTPAEP